MKSQNADDCRDFRGSDIMNIEKANFCTIALALLIIRYFVCAQCAFIMQLTIDALLC